MKELFLKVIEESRTDPGALSKYQKFAKLFEECGELANASLVSDNLVKPSEVEGVIGESADVILVLIDIIQIQYQHIDPETLWEFLNDALDRKSKKWMGYVEHNRQVEMKKG